MNNQKLKIAIIILIIIINCEDFNQSPNFVNIYIFGKLKSQHACIEESLILSALATDPDGQSDLDRLQWYVSGSCGQVSPAKTEPGGKTTFTGKEAKEECVITVRAYDKSDDYLSDSIVIKVAPSAPQSFISSLDWVDIPGGTFQMGDEWGDGDNDELPVHIVTLTDFKMMAKEVTFSQYDECVNEGVCKESNSNDDQNFDQPNKPVVGISWYDANKFCKWINSDLPTEAQWEYTAGGGSQHWKWSLDETIFTESKYCFNISSTCVVGSYEANSFGLYDMSANVKEYCLDKYQDDFYNECHYANNPICNNEDSYHRVVRGGCYNNDRSHNLFISNRFKCNIESSYSYGFRCVSSNDD